MRYTVPKITVGSIAQELHAEFPDDLSVLHATKLIQVALQNRGYVNTEPEDAVWSSNREQILHAIRRHYTAQDS